MFVCFWASAGADRAAEIGDCAWLFVGCSAFVAFCWSLVSVPLACVSLLLGQGPCPEVFVVIKPVLYDGLNGCSVRGVR